MNRVAQVASASTLVALCMCGAHGQVVRKGGGYLFRFKFSSGTTYRYLTVVDQPGPAKGTGLRIAFPLTQTVTTVLKDGGDLVIKAGPLTINGKAAGSQAAYRIVVNRQGRMVSGQVGASSGITEYPREEIQIGQHWDSTVPIAGALGSGTSRLNARYTLVKLTKYHGKPAAELSIRIASSGLTHMTGSGTAYVLASDGCIVHTALKLGVTLSGSQDAVPVNVVVDRS